MKPSDEITMRLLMAAFPNATGKMVGESWRLQIPPCLICPDGAFFYFTVEPKE